MKIEKSFLKVFSTIKKKNKSLELHEPFIDRKDLLTVTKALKNKLPIRDFWIFTGLLVDYMGAFFFWIFGNNWNSHLIHAGFMNILGSLGFYFFLNKIK